MPASDTTLRDARTTRARHEIPMFEHLAQTPKRQRTTASVEMPQTIAFATHVRDQGYRLSYAALALAARELGEDSSTQIAAQRGSTLCKALPDGVQPYICRKAGGYHKAVVWTVEAPKDLRARPVIVGTDVAEAITIWQDAVAKAAKPAKS